MSAPLLTPDPAKLKRSNHGLWLHELVNGSDEGNMPGSPVSLAYLALGPDEDLDTHLHEDSWAYIVVFDAGKEGAITQYGEEMDQFVVQHPGQVVVVPPGLPHRGRNTSKTDTVLGYEFRTCASVFDDRILLPQLDHISLLPTSQRQRRTVVGLPARNLRPAQ